MIDDRSLSGLLLFFFGSLFLLSTFIKSSLSTITRESVVAWKNEGRKGSHKLEELFKMADQHILTFAMLKTLSFAGALISSTLLSLTTTSEISIVNVLIITLIVLLIIGVVETFIKSATKKKGQAISIALYPCITVIATILSPISRSQQRIIEITSRFKDEGKHNNKPDSNDNIAIELGDDGEPLEEHEVRMIKGVFQLDKTVAREIMIPRVDMTISEISAPVEDIATLMLQTCQRKIPIYKD